MPPPLSARELKYVRDQSALIRLAISQNDGDCVAAASALFTAGSELSVDCKIPETVMADRLFSIFRDREDAEL